MQNPTFTPVMAEVPGLIAPIAGPKPMVGPSGLPQARTFLATLKAEELVTEVASAGEGTPTARGRPAPADSPVGPAIDFAAFAGDPTRMDFAVSDDNPAVANVKGRGSVESPDLPAASFPDAPRFEATGFGSADNAPQADPRTGTQLGIQGASANPWAGFERAFSIPAGPGIAAATGAMKFARTPKARVEPPGGVQALPLPVTPPARGEQSPKAAPGSIPVGESGLPPAPMPRGEVAPADSFEPPRPTANVTERGFAGLKEEAGPELSEPDAIQARNGPKPAAVATLPVQALPVPAATLPRPSGEMPEREVPRAAANTLQAPPDDRREGPVEVIGAMPVKQLNRALDESPGPDRPAVGVGRPDSSMRDTAPVAPFPVASRDAGAITPSPDSPLVRIGVEVIVRPSWVGAIQRAPEPVVSEWAARTPDVVEPGFRATSAEPAPDAVIPGPPTTRSNGTGADAPVPSAALGDERGRMGSLQNTLETAPLIADEPRREPGTQTAVLRPSDPPVRPEFARAVAGQIGDAVRTTSDAVVEVRLSPEELGRVRLSFSPAESGMAVAILAERPETLELVRRHIDILASELRQQGHANLSFSFGQQNGPAHHDRHKDNDRAVAAVAPPSTGEDTRAREGTVAARLSDRLDLRL